MRNPDYFQLPYELPTLSSPMGRFALSPLTFSDRQDVANLLLNRQMYSHGYRHGEPELGEPDAALRHVSRRFMHDRMFAIRGTNGEFIGTIGIVQEFEPAKRRVGLGEMLVSPEHWGERVSPEILLTLLDWLFTLGTQRVEYEVDSMNARCISVLASFGFTHEITRRRSTKRSDGSWRDGAVLSIVAPEWSELRARSLTDLQNFLDG